MEVWIDQKKLRRYGKIEYGLLDLGQIKFELSIWEKKNGVKSLCVCDDI